MTSEMNVECMKFSIQGNYSFTSFITLEDIDKYIILIKNVLKCILCINIKL